MYYHWRLICKRELKRITLSLPSLAHFSRAQTVVWTRNWRSKLLYSRVLTSQTRATPIGWREPRTNLSATRNPKKTVKSFPAYAEDTFREYMNFQSFSPQQLFCYEIKLTIKRIFKRINRRQKFPTISNHFFSSSSFTYL